MSLFDYTPMWAGAQYDPVPAGGQVSRLDLFTSPGRDGDAAASCGPAERLREGVYRFTVPDVAPGRYWAVATFTPTSGTAEVHDRAVRLDLPLGTGVLGSPEQVADQLGVPLPLDAAQRERYTEHLQDAQADVVGYLGRPVVPRAALLENVRPAPGSLLDADVWPIDGLDDTVDVVTYEELPDGAYNVRVNVGLDGAAIKPIVRYIVAHAAEMARQQPAPSAGPGGGRRVSSVSAEGQSVSYESAPAAGAAGALPSLGSLSRYRRLVYEPASRPGPAMAPWPYAGSRYRPGW